MLQTNLNPNYSNGSIPVAILFGTKNKMTESYLEDTISYNHDNQLSYSLMPTVGTYSLKSHQTKNGGSVKTDKKNEIDDQKYKKLK